MKLLVVINDSLMVALHREYSGADCAVSRRVVEIELTPEQKKLLELQQIGVNCGHKMYETIESVTLKGGLYENS